MEGIAFSLDDKVAIAHRLDAIGIHYVEGGFPGSNEKDKAFFDGSCGAAAARSTPGWSPSAARASPAPTRPSDFNMRALLGAETPVVTLVGKASAYQVRVALETSREENLSMIRESVSHIREAGP